MRWKMTIICDIGGTEYLSGLFTKKNVWRQNAIDLLMCWWGSNLNFFHKQMYCIFYTTKGREQFLWAANLHEWIMIRYVTGHQLSTCQQVVSYQSLIHQEVSWIMSRDHIATVLEKICIVSLTDLNKLYHIPLKDLPLVHGSKEVIRHYQVIGELPKMALQDYSLYLIHFNFSRH